MTDNNFNFTLIDTKGLEKPGVLLIEKISNACGMIYADLGRGGKFLHERIRSEGNEQPALNNPDASDFSKRALLWDEARKIREYKNVNKIISQAIGMLSSKVSEDTIGQMDNDKINYIMKQAAMVSDTAMQDVWAKLISGEAENPGRFSRQAVNIISVMNAKDAEMFTKMGQFVTDGTFFTEGRLLIYDVLNSVYANQGIKYDTLLHLQSLGLMCVAENPYSNSSTKKSLLFRYGDSFMVVSPQFNAKMQRYVLGVGEVLLTSAGREILFLAEPSRNPEFWAYVIEVWTKLQANPTPILESDVNTQISLQKILDGHSDNKDAGST